MLAEFLEVEDSGLILNKPFGEVVGETDNWGSRRGGG